MRAIGTESGARPLAPAAGVATGCADAVEQRLRNVARVCVAFFILGFVGYFGYALWQISQPEWEGWSSPNDMSVLWAAARLALEGTPLAAFDVGALNEARNIQPDLPPRAYQMAWSYPPQLHALILPLGLMPFALAWILWALLGIVAFWLAMRRLVPGPSIVTVVCASPAVLMCAIQGQTTLVVGALLAGFLASLREGRPVTAGALLGTLTIKPQFGPLLPVALAAAGAWRVIGWATAVAAVIVGLTLVWVGPGYWLAFLDGLGEAAERMAAGWLPRELMISWYAFAVAAGAADQTAMALQMAVMALLAGAVGWAWLGDSVPFELRAATLSVAVPLFSPYVYYYDLVLPLIGVALLLARGYVRGTARGIALGAAIGLVWAAPTLGHFAMKAGLDFGFAIVTPPILTAFLALVLREIASARSHAPA